MPVGFAVRDNDLVEVDVTGAAGIRPPYLAGYAPEGGAYVFANQGRDTRGLYRMNPATGEVLETLLAESRGALEDLVGDDSVGHAARVNR